MKSFPPGSPQEGSVELQRVLDSIQAVNTCLPQPDSGTATATSGLLNACSTLTSGFSVFVLQVQVALCWLWAQISGVLTRLTGIDAAIAALQAASTPGHTGVPTFAIDPGMGDGATYALMPGSSDVQGGVAITCGSGPTPGASPVGVLTFGTNFAAQVYPIVTIANTGSIARGMIPGFNLAPGNSSPATTPVTSIQFNVGLDFSDFLTEGQTFIVFWRIGFTS